MSIEALFKDKAIKAKGKVKTLGEWLMDGSLPIDELLAFADGQKPVDKATCIEAIEFATRRSPDIANEILLHYVTKTLNEDEPRLKWESAKVIGNIAALFPAHLEKSIANLLPNAENNSTVVRWAAAYALSEIVKLRTENNKKLLPKIEMLRDQENDNGVKKKYLDALKKINR